MGVTTPCCGLSGTKFHFKFRWCDRFKKFILADAFCQGCRESTPFPHRTTSFFNIKSKLCFRTPKPDLFTCLMIFVMYTCIIMPEFHALSQTGQDEEFESSSCNCNGSFHCNYFPTLHCSFYVASQIIYRFQIPESRIRFQQIVLPEVLLPGLDSGFWTGLDSGFWTGLLVFIFGGQGHS